MAKRESNLMNMVLTLLLITLISGGVLGYIYGLTKAPISQAKLDKKVKAIRGVLPEFDNNPLEKMEIVKIDDKLEMEFYTAMKGNEYVGTAVKTFSKTGYSGLIWLMVGFEPNGAIHNIEVLEHQETPGLGSKMTTPEFKDQFKKKNPKNFTLQVKKSGGDVDAITAATISSRAFCDAVQRAYDELEKRGGNNE